MIMNKRVEDKKVKEFMEEQNKLFKKYGFFFAVGTKILGVGEDGMLEVKALLDLDGCYVANLDHRNRTKGIDEKGEPLKTKRKRGTK